MNKKHLLRKTYGYSKGDSGGSPTFKGNIESLGAKRSTFMVASIVTFPFRQLSKYFETEEVRFRL